MEEVAEEIQVPFATRKQIRNGSCQTRLLDGLLDVTIYLNGDEPENEGYVSIVLKYGVTSHLEIFRRSLSPCHLTVSVVDADGKSRFPQSLQIDDIDSWEGHPTRLERFVRRRVLLDSREELLAEDTLTLRFEAIYFLECTEAEDDLQRLHEIARAESWFIQDEDSDVVSCYRLDLSKPDSPLCSRLREKSEFFETLFQRPSEGEEDVSISVIEFDAFFNMLCYVRFGNLRHIQFDGQYCDLYSIADKYGVVELQNICSEYLERHLTWDLALNVLWMAEACDEANLRATAFRLALEHWRDVREEYQLMTEDSSWKIPTSIRELTCAVKILNLEDGGGDTLCDLAARRVLLNRKEMLQSPTWKIFAMEMPNLAKVISSFGESVEYKPAEKYTDHALSYNFYR